MPLRAVRILPPYLQNRWYGGVLGAWGGLSTLPPIIGSLELEKGLCPFFVFGSPKTKLHPYCLSIKLFYVLSPNGSLSKVLLVD